MRLIDADELCKRLEWETYSKDEMTDEDLNDWERGVNRGIYRAKRLVEKLSTVDPVKHGHFEKHQSGYYGCSNCHDCYVDMDDGSNYVNVERQWNFCPNCGAKMDEEVNNETD